MMMDFNKYQQKSRGTTIYRKEVCRGVPDTWSGW